MPLRIDVNSVNSTTTTTFIDFFTYLDVQQSVVDISDNGDSCWYENWNDLEKIDNREIKK